MLIAQTTQPAVDWAQIIAPLIPWVIIFAFVYIFVFRMQKRSAGYMVRAREHMEAVETKLDQLIEATKDRTRGG